MYPDAETRELLQHVIRTPLPWRDSTLTRCGRVVDELGPDRVITIVEAGAKVKRLGQQRASLFLCMTCADRGVWPEWDASPVGRMAAECSGAMWRREGDAALVQIELELRAIARMIANHRDEFDADVAAQRDGSLVTIAQLRQRRR